MIKILLKIIIKIFKIPIMKRKHFTQNSFFYDLTFKYLLENPMFKIYIIPIMLIIYFAAELHNSIILSVGEMERFLMYDVKYNYPIYLCLTYLLWICSHYVLTFAYEILFTIYIQSTMVHAYKFHIKNYLVLHHDDFASLGTGKIHSLIERRTEGACKFIEILFMNFGFNITSLIVVYRSLSTSFGYSVCFFNVGVLVLYILFSIFASYQVYKARTKANADYNECSNRIYGILQNYDVIKSYNNDILEVEKLNKKCESVEKSYYWFDVVQNFTKYIQSLIIVIPNSCLIYLAFNGKGFTSLNTAIGFSLYSKQFMTMQAKMDKFGREGLNFLQSYVDITDNQLSNKKLDDNMKSLKITKHEKNIKFKNFTFNFNGQILVNNFNIEIKKGEKIAIVGKNGSGKSTLMKSLLGFYDFGGQILIDDIDIAHIQINSLRNLISYIPQIPYLVEGSVIKNLKYSNKKISDLELEKKCIEFNTHHIFSKLEYGYLTNVGESGKFLSGGQRQQVNFMRGVIKDGDIFLLDEPTANLDHEAEKELLNKIFINLCDKTVMLIIHNFEYLKHFDRILGFNNGNIVVYDCYEEFLKYSYLY